MTLARHVAAAALSLGAAAAAHAQSSSPPWTNAALPPARRAELLLAAMTRDEKFAQLVGAPGVVAELPQCYGARHVPGIPRLKIPTFRITNGPVGVGQSDCVPATGSNAPTGALMTRDAPKATALPSGMAVAASFDRAVATRFGDVIGQETRDLALHVLEGPGLNLARVPQGGRNFEYFGEDPFLTGTMAVAEIRAIQAHGVIAMAKHFVANEQETARTSVNEIIDDRVLHELYLLPFEMAVRDGDVASVMCSYNAVNGPHACEDRHHLTDVLRGQWKFAGYVQSDFFATHGAASALKAGMDHEMPGVVIPNAPANAPIRTWFTPANLAAAIDRGELTMADVDTALARRYRQMFRLGVFDRPVALAPIDTARHARLAREIGEQSAVLLKNAGSLLPLNSRAIRSVALIGQADYATKAVAGCCGGSSDVIPFATVMPLDGVRRALATLGSSATATLTVVANDAANLADAVAAARSADVAIVLAGTISEEGRDLPGVALPNGQDAIVAAVAAANPRTVVVLKDNASALLPWIDAVPAVLEAWFPGQADGDVVARLLFGLATPSGRLPVTFARRAADLPVTTPRQWPGVDSAGTPAKVGAAGFGMAAGGPYTVEYSEGLAIGYRWFDARGIAPLFPFGHGLSYTTFAMSDLAVRPRASDGTRPITVELTVRNTGTRRGAEVPQVYVSLPASAGEPPKRLVGFEKVWLDPGERRRVRITIDPAAASHPLGVWDAATQTWRIPSGAFRVQVARSAAEVVLADTVTVTTARR
ncbi:glycoside hydrolase family 3 domain protein (plasmid) [Gemmatirosa kalamazoonensis]|uniref:Glycoside hydrolase family 3 domain protein n=1 Tax=Gemmatirosa kalamazoonensis TaxID=861299 RepID=W0RT31_9BACT|nr:glycoside hydrolase family 3 C-terminal domain-containing protein [Gemmatirosa kalamazoonensis]AHG92713.1 glycoside hydrolase family 3 domain protein [Gemmatirosa kalamazoonensis]